MKTNDDAIRCLCGWNGTRADLRRLPTGLCCPDCKESDNLFAAPIEAAARPTLEA